MARAAARALIVIVWLEKRPGIVICCLVLKLIVIVCDKDEVIRNFGNDRYSQTPSVIEAIEGS